MGGGFERKPGGSTLVNHAVTGHEAKDSPGKTALTDSLSGAIQLKRAPVQRKASPDGSTNAHQSPMQTPTHGGSALEPGLQRDMESSFGTDFSSVRVHQDGAAESVGARAFARGEAIYVAAGEYHPSSQSSRGLIGHELAHVVQQRAGRVASPQGFGGLGIHDDPQLEAEADIAGERAARGEPAGMSIGRAPGSAPAAAPVQTKLRYSGDLNWINAHANPALGSKFATLAAIERDADDLTGGVDIDIVAEEPASGGAAHFSFKQQKVVIRPLPSGSDQAIESLSGLDISDRVISLSHELQHVCDAFQKQDPALRRAVRTSDSWEELIHSEWRAHATQAKAALEIANKHGPKRCRVAIAT